MKSFELDERLARDSALLVELDLCQLRLIGDSRWPWLVLVPRRPGVTELFELSADDQVMLSLEINRVSSVLKSTTGAIKINVGALGNIVRQLHIHVIARFEGDANWPGPVWGFGVSQAYPEAEKQNLVKKILEALPS